MVNSQHLGHIAFIMDGNGRWASERGMSRNKGHEEGAKTLQKIIRVLGERDISYATFFVFSSENWHRPKTEVDNLLRLLKVYLGKDLVEAQKNNVRIRVAGDVSKHSPVPWSLAKLLESVQQDTAQNSGLTINLCINYGGQDEIVRTAKRLAAKVQEGTLVPEDIDNTSFKEHTDLAPCPSVDLCVRTGGVQRLSNFVLWHLDYAELFFTETHWPAFSEQELDGIIDDFQKRERRFGKLPQNNLAVSK